MNCRNVRPTTPESREAIASVVKAAREMLAKKYEFGIARDNEPDALHRGPMTEEEAREWIREWDEMAENERARKGMFIIIKREVGPWTPATS
jgi:tRNA(His) 5'-end guanylyltransferase